MDFVSITTGSAGGPIRCFAKNNIRKQRHRHSLLFKLGKRKLDPQMGGLGNVNFDRATLCPRSLKYAEYISEFIADDRYIRINGRPLIMLYRPGQFPDARATVERWRNFFVNRGFQNPFIIMPQAFGDDDPRAFGMDAAAVFPPHKVGFNCHNIRRRVKLIDARFSGAVASYDEVVAKALANTGDSFLLFPGVCPQWDNEARRPNRGFSLAGSTPEKYARWLRAASEIALKTPTEDERIIFINAWNEWAEGSYLEPDRHYGYAYLAQTLSVLQGLSAIRTSSPCSVGTQRVRTPLENPQSSYLHLLQNVPWLAARKLSKIVRGTSNNRPGEIEGDGVA